MLQRWTSKLPALWSDAVTAPFRLARTLWQSLDPRSPADARIVEAQLQLVRGNIRGLDFALPLAGILLVPVHAAHGPSSGPMLMWVVVLAACAANEMLILRGGSEHKDIVARAAEDSRSTAFAVFSLLIAWATFAFSFWTPGTPDGHLLALLVLACTLAASGTMFSAHAASAACAIGVLSTFLLGIEFVSGYHKHLHLFLLLLLYAAMIAVQACMSHMRFHKAKRLEQEREKLIDKLRASHEHALAASRAKSEFLANMSHELRTPLNAIIGFSDIVRTRAFGDTAEKYSEYGGFIHSSGHHLLALIGDILDLAKIEAGRKTLHREPIDVIGLVLDEVRLAGESAAGKGVGVIPMVPRTLPLLQADLHAVRQILSNLLSNAVKFTPRGGKVQVSLALNAAREIELCVSDTGLGIAAEDQAHIFERFGQVRPEVTTAERGSGLGLPIVKGLIDMHEGRLRLESALGQGTRITVTFPASSTLGSGRLHVA